jgi:hypothetical protein
VLSEEVRTYRIFDPETSKLWIYRSCRKSAKHQRKTRTRQKSKCVVRLELVLARFELTLIEAEGCRKSHYTIEFLLLWKTEDFWTLNSTGRIPYLS